MSRRLSFPELREQMVHDQIEERGIRDSRVLQALRAVPRHRFVQSQYWEQAYADGPLPTGFGQTISQPYIVALMTELLQLRGDEVVLEVGTGSGYQAAILAHLARRVVTVELFPDLASRARAVLGDLGLANVTVLVGDGSAGHPAEAPYNGILVTAAAPQVSPDLLDQLSPRGRLVVPVGDQQSQRLQVWQRAGDQGYQHQEIIPVAFVPLRGSQGWSEADWKPREPQ